MKNRTKAMIGLTACCALLCSVASLTACHEHVWDDGEVTTAARCGQAGEKTFTCECGEKRTEEVPALEHSWDGGKVTSAPNCTDDGVTTYSCTRDGCEATKNETAGKTGHSFGAWEITEPQADGTGKAVQTCTHTGCTEKNEETLPELTDGGYTVEGDTATCEHAGTATYKITVNGTPFEFTAATPQKAHTEEWAVVKEPSVALPGTAAKFCANCDYDFETTEEMPVLTSDNAGVGKFYSAVTKKPTCTDNGRITYTVSRDKAQELFGGAAFKEFEVTDGNDLQATGHNFEYSKAEKQVVYRCANSGCHNMRVETWEKDMPAGGTAKDSAVKMERGKYNLVMTGKSQPWYTFNVTQAGLYKLTFTYLEKPALISNAAAFGFAAVNVMNSDDTGLVPAVSRNAAMSGAYKDKVVLNYFEEEGFAARCCVPESLVMNFTAEDVGKKVKLQFVKATEGDLDCIINVDIPEDNTPVTKPVLSEGANTVNFAEANTVYEWEFTSAAAKAYSVTVPAGVSAGLEKADGTFVDLLDGEGTANFETAANETVTFSFVSTSAGNKTVTIGEAVEVVEFVLHKGEKLSFSPKYREVAVFTVGEDYEEGQYNLVFTSSSVAFGQCNYYMTVNDTEDWNEMTKGLYLFPQSAPTAGTGIMEGFTRYEGHNVTGTFKAGDKIALAHYNPSRSATFEVELVPAA